MKVYKLNVSRIFQEAKSDGEKDMKKEEHDDEDSSLPDYGSAEFWEKRYKIEFLPFDWYVNWNEIEPIINPYIPAEKENLKSLVVGCGNSTMSNDMVEMSGFKNVVSIDISGSVIEKMKRRYKNENLEWIKMDVTDMQFEDDSFDLVFDKGTVDALTCSNDDYELAKKSLIEIYRVLKPDRFLYMITYEKPINRIPLLKQTKIPWKVHTAFFIPNNPKIVNEDQGTYIYIFQK